MNHHPSDDSANVPSSAQAVVAGVSPVERLRQRVGDSLPLVTVPEGSPADLSASAAAVKEHRESYHLNSSLQKALSCLDIGLEDELTRFRSKQEDDADNTNTIPMHEVSHNSPASSANGVTWEQDSFDFDIDAEILTAEIVQSVMPSSEPATARGGFIIIDGLSITATNSRNPISNVNYAPIALHRSAVPTRPESLDLNCSSGGEIAPFHTEYLSSSQELLRPIQSGYPAADSHNPPPSAVPSPRRSYFTALKIGLMAAVCAIVGGAVYTYLNPSIWASLTATKIVSPATTNSLGQLIHSPNLAANEFTELNLSKINTIKLPTVTATNVTTTPTSTNATPTGVSTTPVAIPFNGTAQIAPPTTMTSQPRLADSLVRSLLPPNFHSFAKSSGYRATSPTLGR
jgi:hypothetical protein